MRSYQHRLFPRPAPRSASPTPWLVPSSLFPDRNATDCDEQHEHCTHQHLNRSYSRESLSDDSVEVSAQGRS